MLLTLSNNKFTGNLPNSLGSLTSLVSLHLHKNRFFGTVHISLKNCTALMILDVGENEFVGNISTWFGEIFKSGCSHPSFQPVSWSFTYMLVKLLNMKKKGIECSSFICA